MRRLTLGLLLLSIAASGQLARVPDTSTWRAEIEQGTALRDRKLYFEAQQVFESALKKAEGFGEGDVRVAVTLNSLALVHHLSGSVRKAAPLYEQSAEILRASLGAEHPEIAKILSSLYELYMQQEQFESAGRAAVERLGILEKSLAAGDPQLVQPLTDAALASFKLGRLLDAEQYQRRALAISQSADDGQGGTAATGLSNLGVILAADNRHSGAAGALEDSISIRTPLDPQSIDVARDLAHLADAYAKRLQFAEAEDLLLRSLELRRKHFSGEHTEVATALNNLGELYRVQGDFVRAEENLRSAVAVWEAVSGPGDVETAVSLYNLAALFDEMDRLSEAAPLLRRAVGIMENELGPNHEQAMRVRQALESVCARTEGDGCEAVESK